MLDTHPQDTNRYLYVFSACDESCVMMIMEDSKMSKIEYGLKGIIYSVYDIPHNLCNISGK